MHHPGLSCKQDGLAAGCGRIDLASSIWILYFCTTAKQPSTAHVGWGGGGSASHLAQQNLHDPYLKFSLRSAQALETNVVTGAALWSTTRRIVDFAGLRPEFRVRGCALKLDAQIP